MFSWPGQASEEMTERRPHEYLSASEENVSGGWDWALLSGAKQRDKKQWTETDAQKFNLNMRKNFTVQ